MSAGGDGWRCVPSATAATGALSATAQAELPMRARALAGLLATFGEADLQAEGFPASLRGALRHNYF